MPCNCADWRQVCQSSAGLLTNNGREFCGKLERRRYELLVAIKDIEHRNTRMRSPRTNGFVERLNRMRLDESPEDPGIGEILNSYSLTTLHSSCALDGGSLRARRQQGYDFNLIPHANAGISYLALPIPGASIKNSLRWIRRRRTESSIPIAERSARESRYW